MHEDPDFDIDKFLRNFKGIKEAEVEMDQALSSNDEKLIKKD